MLFIKEWNIAVCSNMDGPKEYHTKWSKSKINIIWYHFYIDIKNSTNDFIYRVERNSQTQKANFWLSNGRAGEGLIRSTGLTDAHCSAAKSLQSCPTLCDPIDGSLPGSSVPGLLQARVLEWIAIAFSEMHTTIYNIDEKTKDFLFTV